MGAAETFDVYVYYTSKVSLSLIINGLIIFNTLN